MNGPDALDPDPAIHPMPAGPDDYKPTSPPGTPSTDGNTVIATRSKRAPGEYLSRKVTYIFLAAVVGLVLIVAFSFGVFGGSKNNAPVPQVITMATPSSNTGQDPQSLISQLPTAPPGTKGVATADPLGGTTANGSGAPNPDTSASADELASQLNAAASPAAVPTFASTTPQPVEQSQNYSSVPPPSNPQIASVPNPGSASLQAQPQFHQPQQQTGQASLCVGTCVSPETNGQNNTNGTNNNANQADKTGGSGPVAPADGTLYQPQPSSGQGGGTSGEFGASAQANSSGHKDVSNNNIEFANTKNATDGYLLQVQHQPIGRYEIWAGNVLPAELDTGINTNLPGLATAHITQDVYDSRTGQFLLIPKGTRLLGVYNSTVDQGQNRIQIKWSRLIWLDGKYMSLEDMSGGDREGNSGLFADVQDHRGAVIGAALATTALAAIGQLGSGGGASAAASGGGGSYSGGSGGGVVFQSVGSQIAQQGGTIVQQKISQTPELTVPRGENFNVIVDRTMVLNPWTYGGK